VPVRDVRLGIEDWQRMGAMITSIGEYIAGQALGKRYRH